VTYCSGASGAAREGDRISYLAPLEPVKEGWRRIGGSLKPGVGAPRRLRALVPVLRREPRTARQPRVGQRIQPGSSILPRRRLPRALRLFAYDPEREYWAMVTGERRQRRRGPGRRRWSRDNRTSDGQAVGVARDADARPRRIEDRDSRGTRKPSASAPLSRVLAMLSAAASSIAVAERNMATSAHHCCGNAIGWTLMTRK
jgi:hypothetical protein